jgi:hypothetical protein
MPLVPLNSVPASPGVYPILNLDGNFSNELPSAARCYLIGTGSAGQVRTPTRVTSYDNFLQTFDATPATPTIPLVTRDAVKLFFDTTGSIGELFFIRVGTPASPVVAPAIPTVSQYTDSLLAFNPDLEHGIIVSPEAYALLKTAADRIAFQVAVEALVSNFDYQWMHFIDSAPSLEFYAATPTVYQGRTIVPSQPGYTAVTSAPTVNVSSSTAQIAYYTTERNQYASGLGHCSYTANWVLNTEGRLVSPAVAQVAVAQVRYYQDSFRVAPAGAKAPVKGAVDVAYRFSVSDHSALNAIGVNLTKYTPSVGVVLWGARTLYNVDSAFRFIHVRIICNVTTAYLRRAYLPMVFDPIDGAGVTFQLAKGVAVQVLNRFWQAGVLFGQTPSQAYKVECSALNNPAFDLELGRLRVDVWIAPCGLAERVLVGIFRVPIGQVPQ